MEGYDEASGNSLHIIERDRFMSPLLLALILLMTMREEQLVRQLIIGISDMEYYSSHSFISCFMKTGLDSQLVIRKSCTNKSK